MQLSFDRLPMLVGSFLFYKFLTAFNGLFVFGGILADKFGLAVRALAPQDFGCYGAGIVDFPSGGAQRFCLPQKLQEDLGGVPARLVNWVRA